MNELVQMRSCLMGRGFSASISDVDYDELIRQKQEEIGQLVAANNGNNTGKTGSATSNKRKELAEFRRLLAGF
ncbi:MAG: hypothetical protein M3530_04360 [Thermoproteota archaeon]|nr:hypothetical protein [Thermoproteota archaeon]